MGWERGRYYTRSTKLNGLVLREYVGGVAVGELAAALDASNRAFHRVLRDAEFARREQFREKFAVLDARVDEVCRVGDLVALAMLTAAGYHQHERGVWRRNRAMSNEVAVQADGGET